MVPTPVDEPTYGDRALCIALVIQADGAVTSQNIIGSLSAQRLGTKPPTMHNAVS